MWSWSGFTVQGDFGFDWQEVYGLYSRTRLEHMLDLTFSQPQIRNTVEYHFGVGLLFRIVPELKQVLKVKLKFVLGVGLPVAYQGEAGRCGPTSKHWYGSFYCLSIQNRIKKSLYEITIA